MVNQRLNAVRRVRDSLRPAEAALGTSLGNVGKLIHEACVAREELDLPAHVGHEALTHLAAATGMIGEVMERVMIAHRCLAVDAAHVLPEVSFGPAHCPPQTGQHAPSVVEADPAVVAIRRAS